MSLNLENPIYFKKMEILEIFRQFMKRVGFKLILFVRN